MVDEPGSPRPAAPRWLDEAANRDKVYWVVVVLFAAFVVASVVPYEHHPYFPFEQLPGFAGLFGLVACMGLVLAASWMRTYLTRAEDYYDVE